MVAQSLIVSGGEPADFGSYLGWRLRGWLLGLPAGTGMARYQNIGIQIDAPDELIEGPEEEVVPPSLDGGLEAGLEAPEMLAAPGTPGGPIES